MHQYPNQIAQRFSLFLLLLGCSSQFACSSSPFDADPPRPNASQTSNETSATPYPVSSSDPRALVLIGQETVGAADLLPALLEIAGDQALSEYLLDRRLAQLCAEQSIAISKSDLNAERRMLTRAMQDDASADPDQAARLLAEVRDRRGLGPARFEALLNRNAMLRKLVEPDIAISPAMLSQARELRFGPRITLRIITTPTLADAADARTRILQGESFVDVAALFSTDRSAARGGLIGPLSLADPTFPIVIRDAARDLTPGELSETIALDNSYAVCTLIDRSDPSPPAGTPQQIDAQIEQDARLRHQRLLMDRLARALLAEHRPDILDPSLRFSSEAAGN